jgi:outer membrane protein assembly factor BamB
MASALAQNLRTSGPHVGALIVGLLVAAAGAGTMADDWPQFRGPNASGVSTARAPLPARFSLEEKVRWSHTLGDGVSSPIVVGDRVYATAMTGAQTFGVFCFAARDGSLLWKQELATGKLPVIMEPNSHAASTPTADRQRVVVYFSTLGLIAFGAADGRPLWRHELPVPAYLMDWGAAASPILYEDLVIFNQDDDLHPYCIALDAQSGETRWKADRPDMLAGYAVPVLCRAAGRTDLVIAGTGKLQGYDPATGAERWTCNSLLRTIMTSPVVQDDCIYVAVQSYGDTERTVKYALLEWKDTNQDHKLAKTELSPDFAERFDRADRDHDGFLDESELDTAFQSADNLVGGGSIIQSIRGGGQGDVTKTHMVWQLNSRAPSNLASPLVVGGLLYTIKRGGLASCFDAATGAPRYETKRIQNLGEYYASPVAGDGKIYLAGENGFVVVLEQGPQLKVLAKNDLGESCFATPAIADGALYFRTRQKLFCIADDSR